MICRDPVLVWLREYKAKVERLKKDCLAKRGKFDMVVTHSVRISYLNEFIADREKELKA